MTRDEIEEWFESRVPEAVEQLPDRARSVKQWIKALALTLANIAKEEAEQADEPDEVVEADDDELDELDDEDSEED
jgi:uncharacterized protein YgfB (UPF0149 family)